jgi:hypothetical protein
MRLCLLKNKILQGFLAMLLEFEREIRVRCLEEVAVKVGVRVVSVGL